MFQTLKAITCEEYYCYIHIGYAALQTWNSRSDTENLQYELTSFFGQIVWKGLNHDLNPSIKKEILTLLIGELEVSSQI